MIFPILHIPGVGDGMTIALDAVLHVVISHGLAIGFMTMLIFFQTMTYAGKGPHWARISRSLLGPAVVGDVRRDYFIALAGDESWLWIYRDCRAPGGWFLQGYFS